MLITWIVFTLLPFSTLSVSIYEQCDGSDTCDPVYPSCLFEHDYNAQCLTHCPSSNWLCKDRSSIEWKSGDWSYGCDFPQRDLSNALTKSSQCKSKCSVTNGCTHYTWSNYNGGTCWMKYGKVSKDFAIPTRDSTAICGLVPYFSQPINWGKNNWAFACDFVGYDLSNAKTTSDKCSATCVNTEDCTHFTWTDYNGGTCWMKYGSFSKSDAIFTNNSKMICGITELIQWNIGDWANACDFYGNDLDSVNVNSANCRKTCLNHKVCTHYTWTTYNGGTCLMKTGSVSRKDALFINDYSIECGIPSVNLNEQCGGFQYYGAPNCKPLPLYTYCFTKDEDYSECRDRCDPNEAETEGWLCKSISKAFLFCFKNIS